MKRFFLMTPHHTPEQKTGADVDDVIKAHVAARRAYMIVASNQEELTMKISELTSKVDQLVKLATGIKSQSDSAAAQSQAEPQDDPEVEALAKVIDDAIKVLQGGTIKVLQGGTSGGSPASQPPASPEPPGIGLDFSANARDPNAPA